MLEHHPDDMGTPAEVAVPVRVSSIFDIRNINLCFCEKLIKSNIRISQKKDFAKRISKEQKNHIWNQQVLARKTS
jgi:hypothetical protein